MQCSRVPSIPLPCSLKTSWEEIPQPKIFWVTSLEYVTTARSKGTDQPVPVESGPPKGLQRGKDEWQGACMHALTWGLGFDFLTELGTDAVVVGADVM